MPVALSGDSRHGLTMTLYTIDHDQWSTKGFAWAAGYGPLPEMPFIHPTYMKSKKAYWAVNPEPPGLSIDPGGRKWPDLLGNGHSPPMFFVSERVLNDLRSIDAPIARATEMPIAEINAKALRNKPAPRYFVIETYPGIEVDLAATGFPVDANGKAILDPPPKPWPSPLKHSRETWNGADLFDYRHFGPTDGPYINLLCSERVKQLAEENKWTNVRFKPIDLV
jgi:hypothetical protein